MKALASVLISTGVLVAVGLAVPAQAAETSAPAQVAVEAPASAALSFDRVHVTTAAAPARKAPVEVTVPVEVPANVPAVAVEVAVPVMVGGVNPECAEQWMQTAQDGSCLPTECPVAGQTMTVEGNCVAARVESVRPVKVAPVVKVEEDTKMYIQPVGEAVIVEEPAEDSTAATAPKCGELKLGEAWAGVGTHCNLGK